MQITIYFTESDQLVLKTSKCAWINALDVSSYRRIRIYSVSNYDLCVLVLVSFVLTCISIAAEGYGFYTDVKRSTNGTLGNIFLLNEFYSIKKFNIENCDEILLFFFFVQCTHFKNVKRLGYNIVLSPAWNIHICKFDCVFNLILS